MHPQGEVEAAQTVQPAVEAFTAWIDVISNTIAARCSDEAMTLRSFTSSTTVDTT